MSWHHDVGCVQIILRGHDCERRAECPRYSYPALLVVQSSYHREWRGRGFGFDSTGSYHGTRKRCALRIQRRSSRSAAGGPVRGLAAWRGEAAGLPSPPVSRPASTRRAPRCGRSPPRRSLRRGRGRCGQGRAQTGRRARSHGARGLSARETGPLVPRVGLLVGPLVRLERPLIGTT